MLEHTTVPNLQLRINSKASSRNLILIQNVFNHNHKIKVQDRKWMKITYIAETALPTCPQSKRENQNKREILVRSINTYEKLKC